MYSKKFKLLISPTCTTSEEIHHILRSRYDIVYCGIYSHNDDVFVYIQNKTRVTKRVVEELLADTLDIKDVSVFTKVEGTPLCQSGDIPKHGGKRVSTKPRSGHKSNNQNVTNNTTNNYIINQNIIIVNPIGSETTGHITQEFIKDLLDQGLGADTVFRFGTRMYSEPSNMNFITDRKDGFVKVRFGPSGVWETHEKGPAYKHLFENLSKKNREVVENFKAGLSDESIEQFNGVLEELHRDKNTIHHHVHEDHRKFVRNGFNVIAENIKNKKQRMSMDAGERIRLL